MQKGNIKKNKLIRYYPRELLSFYASRKVGDKAVIVDKLKEQPPEDWTYQRMGEKGSAVLGCCSVGLWWVKLNFPIGATVEISSFWDTSEYYCLPIKLSNSAIRIPFKVTETQICQVKEVDCDTQRMMWFEPYSSDPGKQFHFWFIGRYSQMDWDKNAWVQIAEIERGERK